MDACDGYQIAIEMRREGAANPSAGERLDAHLASCPDCRAFDAAARAMTTTFHQEVNRLERRIEWQRLANRVRRTFDPVRRARNRATFVAAMLTVLYGSDRFGEWMGHRPIGPIWHPAGIVLVVFALVYAWLWASGRRAARVVAQTEQTEMLALYRAELDATIGLNRAWRFRFVAGTAMIVLGFALAMTPPQSWHPDPAILAEFLLIGGLFIAAGLYLHLVRIPGLQRELAELR